MEIYKTREAIARKSNWLPSLVVLVLITIGVLLLLQGLAVLLVHPIFQIPLDEMLAVLTANAEHPNGRMALLFVQGLGGGLGFVAAAWVYAKLIDKADMGWQQQIGQFQFSGIPILLMVMVGGILFNSLLIDWNANVQFPSFLADLEKTLRQKEDELMALTKFLTDFANIREFLVGLLVIGVLAGIGEEILFRGVLQPKLIYYTGNVHVGIWLAALIFSAIHFQFYGFFPRMLLGAIFGYLYHYSGSLLYPILAHILNNAFTVFLVYLNKLGKIGFDIEETDQVPLPYALIGLLILLIGMRLFKSKHQRVTQDG